MVAVVCCLFFGVFGYGTCGCVVVFVSSYHRFLCLDPVERTAKNTASKWNFDLIHASKWNFVNEPQPEDTFYIEVGTTLKGYFTPN